MEYQQFINFLKKKNCYEQFVFNFNTLQNATDKVIDSWQISDYDKLSAKSYRCLIKNKPLEDVFNEFTDYTVTTAFYWKITEEGTDFWMNIHNLLKQLYNK